MPRAAVVEAAQAAEAHYRRMWRLRQMSEPQLHALLAGDAAEAAPWVESAARYGVAEAQLRLGRMCLEGVGVPRDPEAALAWFSRAARGDNTPGDGEAMNMVARCYENGWGAPIDLVVAAGWYRLSAEAGHDWGEYNYANMLFDGRGVGRDLEEAVGWYRRASAQGHTRAMNLLARCCEEGWGTPRDAAQAADWYRRSAEGGYFRAQFNHATLLAGAGRLDEAVVWFQRACAAAPPESLAAMTLVLARQSEPRLAALGRELAA
jgi:TPR repeat protein